MAVEQVRKSMEDNFMGRVYVKVPPIKLQIDLLIKNMEFLRKAGFKFQLCLR